MEQLKENETKGCCSEFLAILGAPDRKSKILILTVFSVVFFSALLSFLLMPPFRAPQEIVFTIPRGMPLYQVSQTLYDKGIIRSRMLFELCAKLIGGEKPIVAGTYFLKEPSMTCELAYRIAHGELGLATIRVTFPEGVSNKEMANILTDKLPGFKKEEFLKTLGPEEGFLFPDTYFILEQATPFTIGEMLRSNFEKHIEPLMSDIKNSGHSLRDVVIMASILEKEARTSEDQKMVAGILWKRIKMGMPLQVDASFLYLLSKTSSELSAQDLAISSGYNTYKNKGLPIGPIGNPGLSAITAAINPKASPYLYYLSDNDGVMHYAKTFEEHKANKAKYLR